MIHFVGFLLLLLLLLAEIPSWDLRPRIRTGKSPCVFHA
jgi:hypothetical protein